MVTFWSCLLERINAVSKTLQGVDIDLGTVVRLYSSLTTFFENLRDDDTAFNDFVEQAKAKTGLEHFELVRKRKRKLQADETREGEVDLSGKEKFRIETFITILDRLHAELIKRADAYKNIFEKFNFLYKIVDISESEILNCAKQLQNSFAKDLEESFSNECLHFQCYLKTFLISDQQKNVTVLDLCKILRSKNLQCVFPNVDIALRIFHLQRWLIVQQRDPFLSSRG